MIATYFVHQSRRCIKLEADGMDPILMPLDRAYELQASLPGAIIDMERAIAYDTGWADRREGYARRDDSRIPK